MRIIESEQEEQIKFRMPVIWFVGAGTSLALTTIAVIIAIFED